MWNEAVHVAPRSRSPERTHSCAVSSAHQDVPREIGAQRPPRVGREIQRVEGLKLALVVRGQVERAPIGRELAAARRDLALGGQAAALPGRQIDDVQRAAGDALVLRQHDLPRAGPPVGEPPGALVLEGEARLCRRGGVAEVEIEVGPIAPGPEEGEARAIGRPHKALVARGAVGDQGALSRPTVQQLDLPGLVAAAIPRDRDQVGIGRVRRDAGDRLGVEGELLPRAPWRRDVVELRRLREARRDVDALPLRRKTLKRSGPDGLPRPQRLDDPRIELRDVAEPQSPDLAHGRGVGGGGDTGLGRGGSEEEAEEGRDEEHGGSGVGAGRGGAVEGARAGPGGNLEGRGRARCVESGHGACGSCWPVRLAETAMLE